MADRLPSEKVKKFIDAFIPLTTEDALNVAARVESAVEAGSGRLPDLMWGNHPVAHLIWSWKSSSGQPFTGVFLDSVDALDVAEKFEQAARNLRQAGRRDDALQAEQVARHMRGIHAKDGGVAVALRTGDAVHDQMTAREERAHVIQNRIGGGDIDEHVNLAKLWLEPEFNKAADSLARRGYWRNALNLTLEAATKLLLGEGESMGLSEAEQVSAIRKYVRSINEKYGPHAADDLMLVAEPRYHKIFREVSK